MKRKVTWKVRNERKRKGDKVLKWNKGMVEDKKEDDTKDKSKRMWKEG